MLTNKYTCITHLINMHDINLLDQSLIDKYQDKGVIVLRNIVSSHWLGQLAIGMQKNFDNPCLGFISIYFD